MGVDKPERLNPEDIIEAPKERMPSPDKAFDFLEDESCKETEEERKETDRQIQEVLLRLKKTQFGKKDILKSLRTEENEKHEIGTFRMLRELWGVTSFDCKAALIGEFMFNPDALKIRYSQEKHFQNNLKNGWKK